MGIQCEQLVAHRGFQALYPENSVLSVQAAVALGAQWIEVDLQCTDDGTVLLYHDSEMQRISGIDKSVHTLTHDTFAYYHAYEPQRLGHTFRTNTINSLTQLLPLIQTYTKVQFFLELKEESIARYGEQACIENIIKALEGTFANTILISFSAHAVAMAKRMGFSQTAFVSRNWASRYADLKHTLADYLFINHERINDTNIKAPKPVIAYEVGNTLLANALLRRGCFAVETFEFERLHQDQTVVSELELEAL